MKWFLILLLSSVLEASSRKNLKNSKKKLSSTVSSSKVQSSNSSEFSAKSNVPSSTARRIQFAFNSNSLFPEVKSMLSSSAAVSSLRKYLGTSTGDEESSTEPTANPIPVDLYFTGEVTTRFCADIEYSDSLIGSESIMSLLQLKLPNTTFNDIAKALEFDGADLSDWSYLSFLPQTYVKKRAFKPFCVFMHRFKYPEEFNDPSMGTPIGCLAALIFAEERFDELLAYFGVLLKTQIEAIHSDEYVYLNLMLKAGLKGLPFLEIYFKYAATKYTSSCLAILLLSWGYEDFRSVENFKKVLKIPGFNPNARINARDCKFNAAALKFFKDPRADYSLLAGMSLDSNIPIEILELSFDCRNFDKSAPTGEVFLESALPAALPVIQFSNRSIIFLALLIGNYKVAWAATKRAEWLEIFKVLLESFIYITWWCGVVDFYYLKLAFLAILALFKHKQ